MNKEYISQVLFQVSELSELIKTTLALLIGTLFMALQHSLSPDGMSDEKSEEAKAAGYFKKALNSGNLINIAKAAFHIVSKNMNKVKDVNKEQLSQIVKYALEHTEAFVKRVDSLKDTNSERKAGKWTNYNTSAQMINDIMGTTWSGMAYQFFNTFALGFTECINDENCSTDKALPDMIELLATALGLPKGESEEKK